jgi:NADPH-dependent F420 reductase
LKIAVLGTGRVGGVLGKRWARLGHEVIFGSRDPRHEKLTALLSEAGPTARVAALADAVHEADVVLLAIPWPVAQAELRRHSFDGKVLIDCTNPLNSTFSGLDLGHDTSAAEAIAGWAKGARVVKAFNSVSAAVMADPSFGGQPATLFYCGDDESAKQIVGRLAEDLGFEAVDAGPLRIARYLEPLAMLYIHLAVSKRWGSNCAFKVIRRDG